MIMMLNDGCELLANLERAHIKAKGVNLLNVNKVDRALYEIVLYLVLST